jgi:hypothetical protein
MLTSNVCFLLSTQKNCKYTLDGNIGLQGGSVMTQNMYIFYVCVTFTEYLMCKTFRLMCYVNWFHIVIWNQIILLPSIKNVCIHAFIMDLWENNLTKHPHYRSMIHRSTMKYTMYTCIVYKNWQQCILIINVCKYTFLYIVYINVTQMLKLVNYPNKILNNTVSCIKQENKHLCSGICFSFVVKLTNVSLL